MQVSLLEEEEEEEEEEDCLRGPKFKQQVAVLRTCDAYKYATDAKCRHRCEQTTTTYHTLLALLGKTYGQHTDGNPVVVDRDSWGVPPPHHITRRSTGRFLQQRIPGSRKISCTTDARVVAPRGNPYCQEMKKKLPPITLAIFVGKVVRDTARRTSEEVQEMMDASWSCDKELQPKPELSRILDAGRFRRRCAMERRRRDDDERAGLLLNRSETSRSSPQQPASKCREDQNPSFRLRNGGGDAERSVPRVVGRVEAPGKRADQIPLHFLWIGSTVTQGRSGTEQLAQWPEDMC
ncbi:hypothetical protein DFH09DRAFT_1084787 [Mycena vulgaris]|nr:hypothetical protein DFH09DRAFT_1084787 [Mycena vulgaris]